MELETYADSVHNQLTAAAALGDDRTREIAGSLATAAGPAVRLALLGAVGAAADEITAALLDSPGTPTVAVRLDGDAIRVDVTTQSGEPAAAARVDDGDASARISLRLSDALKTEIEQAASGSGISVNTWLVRAATTALTGSSASGRRSNRSGTAQHVTGWING